MGNHIILKISDELVETLGSITAIEFLQGYIELAYPLVTRKLLLICQNLPSDPVTEFTFAAAEKLEAAAKSGGWDVKPLKGNAATKQNIVDKLTNWKPDFVVYYGHSCSSDNWCGQENDAPVTAVGIHAGNVHLLSGRTASTVSCYTAKNMGPAAIKAGAVAYLGYKDSYLVLFLEKPSTASKWALAYFKKLTGRMREAANAPNKALLQGATYETAYQKGYDAWTKNWQTYKKDLNPTVPATMLKNRKGLLRLGNPKAVARPIGLSVTSGAMP